MLMGDIWKTALTKDLARAYTRVVNIWRISESEDIQFTSTDYAYEFVDCAYSIGIFPHEAEDSIEILYGFLKQGYPSESLLLHELDRTGKFFEKKLSKIGTRGSYWKKYNHLQACVGATHKTINSDTSNRKNQVLVVLISYELWRVSRG